MLNHKLVVLTLLVIPTVVSAQRSRTRGERRPNWDQIESNSGKGPQISGRDLEAIHPVKHLLDKRKDLKLSDDLAKQLKELQDKDKEKNQSLFKAVDSLRGVIRSRSGTKSDEDRVRATLAREEIRTVLQTVLATYDSTLKVAIPLLDESQQKTANALLEKHREESEEMIREKLGGRGPRAP